MKKKIVLFISLIVFGLAQIKAQTNILIYSENFEGGALGVMLNQSGPGLNTGSNKWVINNSYSGTGLYPNTPDESQTTGGTISFAPYGNYLHIYDQNSVGYGVSNCNYDPTAASDNFVQFTSGFCTLGMTQVKFTFFYIAEGSPTAYAELFYSADNGPWVSTGNTYSNQSLWQYQIVQNAAFDNHTSLRFGFRWVNDAGNPPGKMSFGVDDIYVEGTFDNFVTNFNVIVDSISPNPICQSYGLMIYYHLTVPLCGAGFFEVQLSDATGSFANPVSLGIYQSSNQWMNGVLWPTIPSNTPAGSCYKIRINYYYTDYALFFYTNTSICLEVQSCPNTISTLQPVVTMDSDSLCVGSVIDVPFYSTGIFQNGNNYIAQLSDQNGNFPSNPNILGSSPDSQTYDPTQGSSPGSVSGLVNETNHPIIDGCGYYIRVVSTNPATTGMVWGPFCIKHCDIESNHKQDIHACLHDCATGPAGFNTTCYVNIHYTDSSSNAAIYNSATNHFEIEIHNSQSFGLINTGIIGNIDASNDTTVHIHVPCADSLSYLGLAPGLYYIRVIATNSNHPYDIHGTIIRLIIGAPSDNLWIYQSPPDSILCVGDAVYFYPIPYNAGPPMNSSYVWNLNGTVFSTQPSLGILFNGAGTYNLTVQETNFGCVGPLTPNTTSLYVLGPPTAGIIGPSQVCLGDTIYYHVTFHPNVYYEWTSTGGQFIDTTNNELYIVFDTAGIYTLNMLALNKCGQAVGSRNVIVTPHPEATFSVTSPVCTGSPSIIDYTGTTGPPLAFTWNFHGGVAVPGGNNPGPHSVIWNTPGSHEVLLTVTQYGCPTKDSTMVNVLPGPTADFNHSNLCSGISVNFTDSSQGSPTSWHWNFGDSTAISNLQNPIHVFTSPGTYIVQLIESTANGCIDTIKQTLVINLAPTSGFIVAPPFCNGEDNNVTYAGNASANAIYNWNFAGGTIVSGTGQGPYVVSWPGIGDYNVNLTVSENGCTSNVTVDTVIINDCTIEIYNVITPNNDGHNDVFEIKGLESFPKSKLIIFNRWGNEVYESSDYKNNWDGGDQPDGVYYYVLTLQDKTSRNGTVTLLRQ